MTALIRTADVPHVLISFVLAFLGSYVAVTLAEHYRLGRYS